MSAGASSVEFVPSFYLLGVFTLWSIFIIKRRFNKTCKLLTLMCMTLVERRIISIWCQKECAESKLVILCRIMHNWIKMLFKSYEHFIY